MSANKDTIDAETRATSDDHHALRLWLRLYACTNLVEARVRRRLQSNFAMSLPWFDLLAQLDRAPLGLRMTELSSRLMVTSGSVTGLVDALESEGLVARTAEATDRRALRVKFTRHGRRRFRAMADEHEKWIIEMFSVFTERDGRALAEQLQTLKEHILDNVSPAVRP